MKVTNVRHQQIYHPASSPGHAAWVSLWRSGDGRLMLSCQEMEGDRSREPSYDFMKRRYRKNYTIRQLFLSSRDGSEWKIESERAVYMPNMGFIAMKKALPSGEQLAVCWGHNIKGYSRGTSVLAASNDGGASWDIRQVISGHDHKLSANQIKQLSDGSVLVAAYGGGDCVYMLSRDAGETWSEPYLIASGTEYLSFHEPVLEEVSEGKLVCVMRTHREEGGKKLRHNGINYHKVVLQKRNGAYEPGEPVDTGFGFRGRPELMKTSSGVLILAAPGHFFAFSTNDGLDWETRLGLMDGLPHNADPNLVELEDGRILCAYFFGSDWPFPPPVDEYIGCTSFKIEQ